MAYPDDPDVFDQSFRLYLKGELQEAYDLLTRAQPYHPRDNQRVFEWRMDIAAKMGKLDLAEQILEDALDAGCFYTDFVLRKDEDVQDLQGRPRFEALVQRSFARLEEEKQNSKPQLQLINIGKTGEHGMPLLIALHGNSSNVERFQPNWTSLVGTEWLVALPQSSQPAGKGIYSWNNMDLVEQELRSHYARLAAEYPIDPTRVVVAGFSKGGHAAMWAAIRGWLLASGFIGIAPYIPDGAEMVKFLEGSGKTTLKGWFLLGEDDELCTPAAVTLHDELVKLGIHCRMDIFPELQHDFPPDFAGKLPTILRFLTTRED